MVQKTEIKEVNNLKDAQEVRRWRWGFRGGYFLFMVLMIPAICLSLYALPSMKENNEMLELMSEYKMIFAHQNKLKGFVKQIHNRIVGLDLSIKQVQKVEDLRSDINKVKKDNNNSKRLQGTRYNKMAANILLVHYETREALAAYKANLQQVTEDLNICTANVGDIPRAPY